MKNAFQILSELDKQMNKDFIIQHEKIIKEIFIYPPTETLKYDDLKIIHKICEKHKLTYSINYLRGLVIYLKQK